MRKQRDKTTTHMVSGTNSHQRISNIDLVAEVMRDFEARKTARRSFELQWQLNIDFLRGLQNNHITKFDTVVPIGRQFYWQEREVFNHIRPMVEARLGKLAAHKPVINAEENLKKIIHAAFAKVNMDDLIQRANMWSEITGTAFYKVFWGSENKDLSVAVCSPFEIYPDQITAEDIRECRSIIHAKVYRVSEIERIWGIAVEGKEVDVFDISTSTNKKSRRSVMENAAVVVERWERPSHTHPNGRLLIVAGGKLLHKGDGLPYTQHLPFVRQCASISAGCFYGTSVIEGVIPVQRALNAVKNRKTEFLNRLACGVLSVEEGSMDLESLENDGLAPGKVLVYRQGTQAPKFVDTGSMPSELAQEEERLIREFELISGVSNTQHYAETATTSGIALQIMVEQENNRLSRVVGQIMRTVSEVATQVLYLSAQFAGTPKGDVSVTSSQENKKEY